MNSALYIITNISAEDKYIVFDKFDKMSVTEKIERSSKFQTSAKAWQALMGRVPKKRRGGWKVIAYDPEKQRKQNRVHADIDITAIEENPFNWDELAKNLAEVFAKIISYKDILTKELNQVEMELCDCEHYCEFFKCDAARGYKLYAMIRDRRIKRRFYKDELRKANAILNLSYTDIANGEIKKVLSSISKQSYTPRVLTELFDV